jgi:hypothetical protein
VPGARLRMTTENCKGPPPDCRRIVIRLRCGIKSRCASRTTSTGQRCLVNVRQSALDICAPANRAAAVSPMGGGAAHEDHSRGGKVPGPDEGQGARACPLRARSAEHPGIPRSPTDNPAPALTWNYAAHRSAAYDLLSSRSRVSNHARVGMPKRQVTNPGTQALNAQALSACQQSHLRARISLRQGVHDPSRQFLGARGTWRFRHHCSLPDAGALHGPVPNSRPGEVQPVHRDRAK